MIFIDRYFKVIFQLPINSSVCTIRLASPFQNFSSSGVMHNIQILLFSTSEIVVRFIIEMPVLENYTLIIDNYLHCLTTLVFVRLIMLKSAVMLKLVSILTWKRGVPATGTAVSMRCFFLTTIIRCRHFYMQL